jgi:hypothetical protein
MDGHRSADEELSVIYGSRVIIMLPIVYIMRWHFGSCCVPCVNMFSLPYPRVIHPA